ncbi:RDD family protein [Lentibacillus persicus]|uniref:RDD family protein n=1 Tax=Lentibacillus persicus TaxID=640948 RepID=A0A1I1YCB9_9BACI|nr:RDD family protein [Lentibacillus persicus]SFE17059.1 RDD family protein [Lentibacillus persicus]
MPYAPFKTRIFAFLLDYLIIAAYGIFVVGSISFLFPTYITPLFFRSPAIAEVTGFVMITLPVSLYFILCESSKWQGTWGKVKLGIRVVNKAGDRIEISRSVFRTAFKFLPWEAAHFAIWRLILPNDFPDVAVFVTLIASNMAILIYLISPLTHKSRRNVYDWAAGTKVVRPETKR